MRLKSTIIAASPASRSHSCRTRGFLASNNPFNPLPPLAAPQPGGSLQRTEQLALSYSLRRDQE